MFRRILFIVLTLMLMASLGAAISCGAVGVSGTYVNEDNSDEYLELNEDGTFYLKEMSLGLDGEWEVKDGELRLHFKMGMVATGEIKGDKIIDEDGEVWVKQTAEPTSPKQETSLRQSASPPAPMQLHVDRSHNFSISVPVGWQHITDRGGSIWMLPEEASDVNATFIEVIVLGSPWPEPFTEQGIRDYYDKRTQISHSVLEVQIKNESLAQYSIIYEGFPEEMYLQALFPEYHVQVRARGSSEKRLEEYRDVFEYCLDSFEILTTMSR